MEYNNQMPDSQNPENGKTYPEEYRESNPQPINKNQKYAVALLGFLAFMVIGMWMLQFKKTINSPFEYKAGETAYDGGCVSGNCGSVADLAEEKNKDTDGDGLSDYDEINIYETSPYIEDSDSDGLTDWEEVEAGGNPSCPAGRNCSGSEIVSEEAENRTDYGETYVEDIMTGLSSEMADKTGLTDSGAGVAPVSDNASTIDGTSNKFFTGNITVDELRSLLLSTGSIKPEVLNQFSDEELMEDYQAMMGG